MNTLVKNLRSNNGLKLTAFLMLILLDTPILAQQLQWTFKAEGRIYATPLVDNGTIYVGSGDHNFYAIDKNTGKENWRFETKGAIYSTAFIIEDLVLFGSADGNLYALNINNGSVKWTFSAEGEKTYGIWDYYLSSPQVDGNIVYWGSGDGHLYTLDLTSGQLKWKFKTEGIVHADPVIDDDKVFIGSFDGNLYALNKLNGELIWNFSTLGAEYFPKGEIQKAVVVDDNSLYFGSRDYNIYCLDKNTGKVKWNMRETAGWIIATPTIDEEKIFFGTSDAHKFYCLNKNYGGLIWETKVSMRVYGSAVVHKGLVYFGSFDGTITGLDIRTGETKWKFQTEGSKKNYGTIFNNEGHFKEGFQLYGKDMVETENQILDLGSVLGSPVIIDKTMYAGSADGNVYAILLNN